MHILKRMSILAIAIGFFMVAGDRASAQISVSIGAPPVCPYGYYEVPPYNCAPDGYYGPEWFNGGAFIGSGPWFHGLTNFHGKVNNHFDQARGYKGPVPNRGDRAETTNRGNVSGRFRGNEVRDGRGNVGKGKH